MLNEVSIHVVIFPEMKSRQRILTFLLSCIGAYVCTEIILQYNWRSPFPSNHVISLQGMAESSAPFRYDPPLKVVTRKLETASHVDGFCTVQLAAYECEDVCEKVFTTCCGQSREKCIAALEAANVIDSESFWLFKDPSCNHRSPSMHVDNVGYAVSDEPDFLRIWRYIGNKSHELSGPFKSLHPIVFVRSLQVLTEDNEISNKSSNITYLENAVDGVFDIIHETSSLFGGQKAIKAIEESLSATDPHEQSRLINKELRVWTGSTHISTFGSYTMPPIGYIASVSLSPQSPKTIQGLYQVDNFGFINIVVDKQNESTIDPIRDITRSWVGGDLQTNTDIMSFKIFARRQFIKKAIDNLVRLMGILDQFSDLRFGQSTSEFVVSAISHIEASLNIDSPSLQESLRHARIAVIESMEALNDQSVSDPPFFSMEYTFALYAPLGLPITVPVIGALIRLIREKRALKRKKLD